MPHRSEENCRAVFFVSDHTGITAENIGMALLAHFSRQNFDFFRRPFTKSVAEAEKLIKEIDEYAVKGLKPLVFTTITVIEILETLKRSQASVYDVLGPELVRLEGELSEQAELSLDDNNNGHHSINEEYFARVDALEFALKTDDGKYGANFEKSDLILVGVSRVGKTPSSFYLALMHGKRVSNYPLTDEDFERGPILPPMLNKHKRKMYGLTISPQRLHEVRVERSPTSHYATLKKCQEEVRWAENLFRDYNIPMREITNTSVEELAAELLKFLESRGKPLN